jgi:hypothetical protein
VRKVEIAEKKVPPFKRVFMEFDDRLGMLRLITLLAPQLFVLGPAEITISYLP